MRRVTRAGGTVGSERHDELLDYWFGPDPDHMTPERLARWRALGALHVPNWRADPAFEAELRHRFGDLIEALGDGLLDAWLQDPRGRLAYVLVGDTLPRALHRGRRAAYVHDSLALAAVERGVAAGIDEHLGLAERGFFYMPLTHAESEAAQARSVELYDALVRCASSTALDSELRAVLAIFQGSALRHARIVRRFGRFPHRNALLGRPTTATEQPYLDDPWGYFEPEGPSGAAMA